MVEFGRGSGERQDAKERAKQVDHYNSTAQVKKATVRDSMKGGSAEKRMSKVHQGLTHLGIAPL